MSSITLDERMNELRKLSIKELQKRIKARTVRKRLEIEIPNSKGELVHLLAQLLEQADEIKRKRAKEAGEELPPAVPEAPPAPPEPTLPLPNTFRMELVQQGAKILKCGPFGKPHYQFLQINDRQLQLSSDKDKKPNTVGSSKFHRNFLFSVPLRSIKELIVGQSAFKKSVENQSSLSFSILYADTSLDCVCEDSETFNAFVSIINYYSIENQSVNPFCCIVSGKGIQGGAAGAPFMFTIEARDSMNIVNTSGTCVFEALLEPKTPKLPVIKGDIVVTRDGLYNVYFTCFKSGEYNININLVSSGNIRPILGSPFKAYIDAGVPDVQKCNSNKIPNYGYAGVPVSFLLYSKDKYNNFAKLGEHRFDVKVESPDPTVFPQVQVEEQSVGRYSCNITCFRTGSHKVTVNFQDRVLASSELVISCGEAHPSQCSHEFFFKTCTSLETLVFKFYARDAYGNSIVTKPSDYLVILVNGQRSKGDFSYTVTDNEDGSCTVYMTLYWSGTHTISLLVYEMDIKMSPITIQVTPDVTEKERYIRSVLEEGLAKKIAQWGVGKPVYQMLNELNMVQAHRSATSSVEPLTSLLHKVSGGQKLEGTVDTQLGAQDSVKQMKKVYMRVLLWLHPDKVAKDSSIDDQFECMEVFKLLQSAWSEFKNWKNVV